MKKIIAIFSILVVMFSFSACEDKESKKNDKFTCELCGEEKSGKKHTEEFFGEKITYCDDCQDEISKYMK